MHVYMFRVQGLGSPHMRMYTHMVYIYICICTHPQNRINVDSGLLSKIIHLCNGVVAGAEILWSK